MKYEPSDTGGDGICLPPPDKAVATMHGFHNGRLHRPRHHLPNCLAGMVEADPLGHFQWRVPAHCQSSTRMPSWRNGVRYRERTY